MGRTGGSAGRHRTGKEQGIILSAPYVVTGLVPVISMK